MQIVKQIDLIFISINHQTLSSTQQLTIGFESISQVMFNVCFSAALIILPSYWHIGGSKMLLKKQKGKKKIIKIFHKHKKLNRKNIMIFFYYDN